MGKETVELKYDGPEDEGLGKETKNTIMYEAEGGMVAVSRLYIDKGSDLFDDGTPSKIKVTIEPAE